GIEGDRTRRHHRGDQGDHRLPSLDPARGSPGTAARLNGRTRQFPYVASDTLRGSPLFARGVTVHRLAGILSQACARNSTCDMTAVQQPDAIMNRTAPIDSLVILVRWKANT